MTSTYPFNTPIILTDPIFALYGGKGTGTFSSAQLQLAYQIAESQVVNYIGTFLLPTTVTGTYVTVPTTVQRIVTDYGYVSQILSVSIKSQKVTLSGGCELVDTDACAFIYSDTYGYLDVNKIQSICGCGQSDIPYQYEIAYVAGLPTGVSTQPSMLAAMTMVAGLVLNELYPGIVGMNEAPGDAGIQEWESFGYHERRTAHALRRTAFGGSAVANKAAQLIDSCIKKARRSLRM